MIDKLLNMLEKFNVKRAIELLNNNTSDLSGELPGERLYPMETLILPEYQQVTTPLQVKEFLKSVKQIPLLNTLDKEQKVWYLYWREEILKGNYIDAELGYVLIFIYELLNYTFNDNAAFNLSMLDRIYTNYHNRHFSLGDFLPRWICDFCYELEEYDLERKWTAKIRYHELSAYESLKQFENKLETVSITFWKQFMRYNRTRFFKENRNLIYKVFKTSIALLAREYQAQGRNLIEAWIPCNEEVGYARQLFTNAVIGREVKTRLETKRLPNLKMREDLSALFRLAKNIARIKVGETSQLNVAEAHFPEGFGYALLELFRDKSQPPLFYRTRFVKAHDQANVGLGSTIPRPPDLLEQDVATIPPLEFDLERIDILDKESKELIELFALRYDDAEEIVEILKISEKDKESEKEKALNNCAVSVGENFEALFAELTRLECDFLLGFEDLTRVRQEGMNYLKTRRVMMGVFITTLNQKSLDCLGDNLIEQEGDVLRFNEEFKQVLQRLAEEEKVRGRKNS
ncbi:MAG TPA: TerB N-terminal domain-containing protein [Desulfosporosinus sp.]|nr:TerB N-terminal domain-containing protein [Desulfosporosinus sp.]